MNARSMAIGIALAASTAGSTLDAQVRGVNPPDRAAARAGQVLRSQDPREANANRLALERQVRQALARVARRQLGLDAAKMSQLTAVDRKFERERRALVQRQRQTRLALRTAMEDSTSAAQSAIAQHLDTLLVLERRRIDLLEAEQKELATFLTPLQRAKYQALQERVRRRLEELRVGAPGPDSALGIRPQRPRH